MSYQAQHGPSGHPGTGTYLAIAAVLLIITIAEVGVFYVPAFKPILAPAAAGVGGGHRADVPVWGVWAEAVTEGRPIREPAPDRERSRSTRSSPLRPPGPLPERDDQDDDDDDPDDPEPHQAAQPSFRSEFALQRPQRRLSEIGRASCRERG